MGAVSDHAARNPRSASGCASARLSAVAGVLFTLAVLLAAPAIASAGGLREMSFAPHRLIVGFESDLDRDDRASILAAEGAGPVERLMPGTDLVELEQGASVREGLSDFRDQEGVRYAQPDYILELDAVPNDSAFPLQWGLQNTGQTVSGTAGTPDADIDAPEAWDLSTGSPSVKAAIIDTGVDYEHPDLAGNIAAGGYDFRDEDGDPRDLNGHGTHVAGIVGAVGNNGVGVTGVNQRVSIVPIRVGSVAGPAFTSDVIQGINYSGVLGADVANISIGIPRTVAVVDAVRSAPNTLFVLSAGNDASNNDGGPLMCNTTEPNVLCVAATNQSDGLAGFSNYGANSVELGAPGENVRSTYPRNTRFFDNFNDNDISDWTVTPGTWLPQVAPPDSSPDRSLSDSAGLYATNANAGASHPVNLVGQSFCTLTYQLYLDMNNDDPDDLLRVEEWNDPGFSNLHQIGQHTNTTGGDFDSMGWELDGEGEAGDRFRFRLVADGDGLVDDGAYVDAALVSCESHTYTYLDGTSMAAPMVTGVAALAKAFEPQASTAEVRSAIVNGVDPVPALVGKTITGGRLNARRTLELVNHPPETEIVAGPAEGATVSNPNVSFAFSSEPGAVFQCSLDGRPFTPCGSPLTGRVTQGHHDFAVRAVDVAGAADPTPATRSFTVNSGSCRGKLVTVFSSGATITGTAGRDVIAAASGTRRIAAGPGNDVVCGRRSGETIGGGSGKDLLVGAGGADRLKGSAGPDRLLGGAGNDLLAGGAGNDRCNGGPGRDRERSC